MLRARIAMLLFDAGLVEGSTPPETEQQLCANALQGLDASNARNRVHHKLQRNRPASVDGRHKLLQLQGGKESDNRLRMHQQHCCRCPHFPAFLLAATGATTLYEMSFWPVCFDFRRGNQRMRPAE